MKFHNFLIVSLIFSVFLVFVGSTAEINGMESQNPSSAQNNAPEHIPGSNMIGAGRGRRVQNWKATQGANTESNPSQAHDQQPQQQHGASSDRK